MKKLQHEIKISSLSLLSHGNTRSSSQKHSASGAPIMSSTNSLSSHSCFHSNSFIVSLTSVYKSIQVSLSKPSNPLPSNSHIIASFNFNNRLLGRTQTDFSPLPQISFAAHSLSYSLFTHLPIQTCKSLQCILSWLKGAPAQSAQLQIRIIPQSLFSLWAAQIHPKSDFIWFTLRQTYLSSSRLTVPNWGLYHNHLESFSKYLHEQFYPSNHFPIQAHIHLLFSWSIKNLWAEKTF